MRVVTWNVNSVRQRLPRLIGVLERHGPDVVCLQETKVEDADFPTVEIVAAGYEVVSFGQRAYNGVAILAREGLGVSDVVRGFDGDPAPDESRVLSLRAGDLRVVCVYVVNGKEVGNPSYDLKLRWLDALAAWVSATFDPAEQLVICGDFNVTPDDRDVHDPDLWRGRNLATDAERERIASLLRWGLVDLVRRHVGDQPGPWTYWDYRAGAFHKGWGLRIDLVLGTRPVAERLNGVVVDRDERKPTSGEGKPSDHAPLIVTLDD